jgi:hypothetical protein
VIDSNKLVLHFVTFADGNEEIIAASKRLINQCNQSNLFASISAYDRKYLENFFDETITEIMSPENRGFGYWLWKPLLIQHLLATEVKENEVLIYSDSGTELNVNIISSRRLRKFVAKTEQQPILAFRTNEPEFKFTKKKCLEILVNASEAETFQVEATTIVLRNCNISRSFVDNWVNIACSDNFSFIDDTLGDEMLGFVDHRHDQSIFSVMYKNYGFKAYHLQSPEYSENPKKVSAFQSLAFNGFAIWPIRNRSGHSILKPWQTNSFIGFLTKSFYLMNKPRYRTLRFSKMLYYFFISKMKLINHRKPT